MRRALRTIMLAAAFTGLLTIQAGALEYSVDPPANALSARPTSQEVVRPEQAVNVDRSKDAALIPPGFGTPTSYLPGSGEALTPNLIPGALDGGWTSAAGSGAEAPSAGSSAAAGSSEVIITYPKLEPGGPSVTTGFTAVTSGLYYANGSLGTLDIPTLGLRVKIYEGTGSAALAKGAGHFTGTSIWAGNVSLAGHNRGVTNHFGKIHTLNIGDTITLTTKLGTRTYAVTSVSKVKETDTSGTAAAPDNQITLYTCVRNESAYRWCVKGTEI